MLRLLRNSKAQSIAEYVLMGGAIIIAIVAMSTYVRRGINATIKVAADELGAQADSEENEEYGTRGSTTSRVITDADDNVATSLGGSRTTNFSTTSDTQEGVSISIKYDDK